MAALVTARKVCEREGFVEVIILHASAARPWLGESAALTVYSKQMLSVERNDDLSDPVAA